ncbi:MAG: glycosyltransferase family 2 protein [Pseudomonadota bacterium]
MQREVELSIIVVSYNTKQMTLECLRSLAAETTVPYELLVVDNDSSDGSPEAIAAEFPDARLFALDENLGFARANNHAVVRATGRYVLLLNPDTLVLDGAVDKLLAFAQAQPEARIWGGRTLFADGSLNPTNCYRRMTLAGVLLQATGLNSVFRNSELMNPEGYGGWPRDSEREVDIVTGCFLMIERTFWNELGGFDESFVMYGEEADLCLRARALGARPRVSPEPQIVHYGGGSQVRADKLVRLLKAKVTLIRRHFPSAQTGLGVALLRLWPYSRMLATRLLSRTEGYKMWREVWTRRGEWAGGYEGRLPGQAG